MKKWMDEWMDGWMGIRKDGRISALSIKRKKYAWRLVSVLIISTSMSMSIYMCVEM